MKKILVAMLLCATCVFLLSSCMPGFFDGILKNGVEVEHLKLTEKDGKTYIEANYFSPFVVDFENKTFAFAEDGEMDLSAFTEDPKAFQFWMHASGGYKSILPEGFEGIDFHMRACELENEESKVKAWGYVREGLLVGFVQVYDNRGTWNGTNSLEEIVHSMVFTYDGVNDVFTVEHTLNDVAIVAQHGDTVLYWKDKAYYSYHLSTGEETYLVEDKAYDKGMSQRSSSGVFSNEEMCIIHMVHDDGDDTHYMCVYEWATGEFSSLDFES